MTTSAERLIKLAEDDYTLSIVPAEHLVSIMIDCAVALAFRAGKTPRDVFEDAWKTAGDDASWKELMNQRRRNDGEGPAS